MAVKFCPCWQLAELLAPIACPDYLWLGVTTESFCPIEVMERTCRQQAALG